MCELRIIKMKGEKRYSCVLCLDGSRASLSEAAESLLMQSAEWMKSSQANVDASQGQSLKETEAWRDDIRP